MAPYVGEIRMFGGNFAPAGWAFCNGQQLAISEFDTLFNLIGTTYGGDGQETFNLPDLQSRVPIHMGQGPGLTQNYIIGEAAGVETVTLTTQQLPVHSHPALGNPNNGSLPDPANNVNAKSTTPNVFLYHTLPPGAAFNGQAVAPVGGSQPHENLQPYLAISFIISLYGIYPQPN